MFNLKHGLLGLHSTRFTPLIAARLFSSVHLQFSLDKNYYRILGIATNATQQEIKKQFFQQAKQHHPDMLHSRKDVQVNHKEAHDKFKEMNEAYQVLSDPELRQRYDAFLGVQNEPTYSEDSLYA
jgi:DnaJ-class molecular chaperone